MIESIENIINIETIENVTNITSVTNNTVIDSREVIAVTSNLDSGTYAKKVDYYDKNDIELKLLDKQNINSYIDGGEF